MCHPFPTASPPSPPHTERSFSVPLVILRAQHSLGRSLLVGGPALPPSPSPGPGLQVPSLASWPRFPAGAYSVPQTLPPLLRMPGRMVLIFWPLIGTSLGSHNACFPGSLLLARTTVWAPLLGAASWWLFQGPSLGMALYPPPSSPPPPLLQNLHLLSKAQILQFTAYWLEADGNPAGKSMRVYRATWQLAPPSPRLGQVSANGNSVTNRRSHPPLFPYLHPISHISAILSLPPSNGLQDLTHPWHTASTESQPCLSWMAAGAPSLAPALSLTHNL